MKKNSITSFDKEKILKILSIILIIMIVIVIVVLLINFNNKNNKKEKIITSPTEAENIVRNEFNLINEKMDITEDDNYYFIIVEEKDFFTVSKKGGIVKKREKGNATIDIAPGNAGELI